MPINFLDSLFCNCDTRLSSIYNKNEIENLQHINFLNNLKIINGILKKNKIRYFIDYITLHNMLFNESFFNKLYLGVFIKDFRSIKNYGNNLIKISEIGTPNQGYQVILRNTYNIDICISLFYVEDEYIWSLNKINTHKDIYNNFKLIKYKFNGLELYVPENNYQFLLDCNLV
jgi:hypothetical protein